MDLFRALGGLDGQALSLRGLGMVCAGMGCHPEAIDRFQESLTISAESGNSYRQAEALLSFGDALQATARYQEAQAAWQEALAICEALQIPMAAKIRRRLTVQAPQTRAVP